MNTRRDDNELLDLIDDQGNIIGQDYRAAIYDRGAKNFRTIELFLRNLKGDIFITRRAAHKRIAPGKYDNCGEHVLPGESDIAAARRGVQEEYGLDLPLQVFQFLGYATPAEGMWGYASVYVVEADDEPQISCEHEWGKWLSPFDIMHILRKNPRQFRGNVQILLGKHARELFPQFAGIV